MPSQTSYGPIAGLSSHPKHSMSLQSSGGSHTESQHHTIPKAMENRSYCKVYEKIIHISWNRRSLNDDKFCCNIGIPPLAKMDCLPHKNSTDTLSKTYYQPITNPSPKNGNTTQEQQNTVYYKLFEVEKFCRFCGSIDKRRPFTVKQFCLVLKMASHDLGSILKELL